MPMPSNIDHTAFYLDGGPIGVLLIHGFTGSAAEMRLVGQYLNERGLTVSAPLLPGHGTTPDDLNNYGWKDWVGEVNRALIELQEKRDIVFVSGLSLGALLALNSAATSENIEGVITFAAAIDVTDWHRHLPRIFSRFIRQLGKPDEHWADPEAESLLWSYDTYPTVATFELLDFIPIVKEHLPQITCPLLAIYSTADPTVSSDGVQLVFEQVSSKDKQLVELNESGHVITVDKEWQKAAEITVQFILDHVPVETKAG